MTSRISENLKRKQKALERAVTPWLNTQNINPRFPRLSTQTTAAVNLLAGVLEGIESEVRAAKLPAATLENRILGGYQFWNVFQSKFSQRLEPLWEQFLKAADELAWLSYLPAREAMAAEEHTKKEPPLIYFSNEASPFIDERGTEFQPEGMPAYLIKSYGWPEASRRLPFAMIGVPWFQTGFLPGALAIAHEVGHSVETDFGLTASLEALLAAAAPCCAFKWQRWSGEIFADLWGCLTLGPAFVQSLAETLWSMYQMDPNSRTKTYPPPPLRVWWNVKVLAKIGHNIEMKQIWPGEGEFDTSSHDAGDAALIADSWLTHSFSEFGNRTLPAILNFTDPQQKVAEAQAMSAKSDDSDGHSDVRALWSAIQIAWDQSATDRLLRRIERACNSAARARGRKKEDVVNKTLIEKRTEHLRNLGRSIL